jgi:hypothetical protein
VGEVIEEVSIIRVVMKEVIKKICGMEGIAMSTRK